MTDLRQGVTETQHAAIWSATWDFEERIRQGSAQALLAHSSPSLKRKMELAITAAALLIDAADEISRLITADTTGGAN